MLLALAGLLGFPGELHLDPLESWAGLVRGVVDDLAAKMMERNRAGRKLRVLLTELSSAHIFAYY